MACSLLLAVFLLAGSLYWPVCFGTHLGNLESDEGLNPAEVEPMPVDVPFDRQKRGFHYGSPYGGGGAFFPGGGVGTGTALATGSALNGITQTNGQTFTDAFGNANSNAHGLSKGYMPSSTSVANSASRGFGGSPFFRRRREAGPSFLPAGTAEGRSAGNAVDGRAANAAITYTDPYGAAKSQGAGFSDGYVPSSMSEVRSDTNAPYIYQPDPFAFGY